MVAQVRIDAVTTCGIWLADHQSALLPVIAVKAWIASPAGMLNESGWERLGARTGAWTL